jgi:hypothetical protein
MGLWLCGIILGLQSGGGELVSIYPGNNVITENNIAERQGGMIDEQSIASTTNNRQFGNIGLNVHIFTHLERRPRENPGPGSQNSYLENVVGIEEDNGIEERGGPNSIINHASVFGTKGNGITTDAGALKILGLHIRLLPCLFPPM